MKFIKKILITLVLSCASTNFSAASYCHQWSPKIRQLRVFRCYKPKYEPPRNIRLVSTDKPNKKISLHSSHYFDEQRDLWWNNDFLKLMSQRWNLKNVKKVLDVGCGIGHWGQTIAPFLGNNFTLYGLDAEKEWITKASDRAKSLTKLRGNFNYLYGKAEKIPFEDNFFDMVTCQTLLIHVSNPMNVIREMVRVLKPQGIIIATEPNNITNSLILNSTHYKLSAHDILDLTKLQLYCEKGKELLGEGNNSLGDLVPGLFAKANLSDIEVYLSDKALPLFPPYQNSEQKIMKKQIVGEAKSNFWNGKKEELRRYFIAFDPNAHEFDRLWTKVIKYHHHILKDIEHAEFHVGGSSVMYLVSGRKPVKNDEN